MSVFISDILPKKTLTLNITVRMDGCTAKLLKPFNKFATFVFYQVLKHSCSFIKLAKTSIHNTSTDGDKASSCLTLRLREIRSR